MFNAVAHALQEVLHEPSEKMFGLLSEIRDNLRTSVELLTEIRDATLVDLDPGEEEKVVELLARKTRAKS
jgi:hypothetical protein